MLMSLRRACTPSPAYRSVLSGDSATLVAVKCRTNQLPSTVPSERRLYHTMPDTLQELRRLAACMRTEFSTSGL